MQPAAPLLSRAFVRTPRGQVAAGEGLYVLSPGEVRLVRMFNGRTPTIVLARLMSWDERVMTDAIIKLLAMGLIVDSERG